MAKRRAKVEREYPLKRASDSTVHPRAGSACPAESARATRGRPWPGTSRARWLRRVRRATAARRPRRRRAAGRGGSAGRGVGNDLGGSRSRAARSGLPGRRAWVRRLRLAVAVTAVGCPTSLRLPSGLDTFTSGAKGAHPVSAWPPRPASRRSSAASGWVVLAAEPALDQAGSFSRRRRARPGIRRARRAARR